MKGLYAAVGVAIIAIAAAFSTTPVFADSPGQLSNGAGNYEVRNVTTGGSYGQSATATCSQTVKYSVLLANSDFGKLRDVTVRANLATGAISASATNTVNANTSVSGNVSVKVDKGSLEYVNGSTVRVSYDGKTTQKLADGVVGAGVNAGELGGSTQMFVQFEAKVKCKEEPPVEKKIEVCRLSDKKIVTIKEADFDAKRYSKSLKDCDEVVPPVTPPVTPPATPEVPGELPQTGFGEVSAIVGLGSLVAAISYYVASRRV